MNNKSEIFRSFYQKNKEEIKTLEDIHLNKSRKIKLEQEEMHLIDKQIQDISNMLEIYNELDIDKVEDIADGEFNEIIYSLKKYPVYHDDLIKLSKQSKDELDSESAIHSIISLVSGSTQATPTNAGSIALQYPKYFGNFSRINEIIEQYKQSILLDQSIQFIKKNLPFILPDISHKFEAWLLKVNSKKTCSPSCGELEDLRTLIYYELYRDNGSINSIEHGIKKFIFGSTPFNSIYNNLVSDAKKIWDDLSGDVKKGKTSPAFNKAVFMNLTLNLKEIITARKKYYAK